MAGKFGKLFGRKCRVPVLFFQVIEGGIFGKDKAVILYVVHFRQPGALFPKLHEDVEHNFLRPFFVLHEIAGNTEQAVVAQIVESLLFLHISRMHLRPPANLLQSFHSVRSWQMYTSVLST